MPEEPLNDADPFRRHIFILSEMAEIDTILGDIIAFYYLPNENDDLFNSFWDTIIDSPSMPTRFKLDIVKEIFDREKLDTRVIEYTRKLFAIRNKIAHSAHKINQNGKAVAFRYGGELDLNQSIKEWDANFFQIESYLIQAHFAFREKYHLNRKKE